MVLTAGMAGRDRPQGTCSGVQNRCVQCTAHDGSEGWAQHELWGFMLMIQIMKSQVSYLLR